MKKILIAFFSHKGETYFKNGIENREKGNAQIIAEKARMMLKADMFEIRRKEDYPQKYSECLKISKEEFMMAKNPELLGYMNSLDDYSDIVLIYPCWWGTMPRPVFSFLEHYDMTGKNIFPICTHEGSKMGESEVDLTRVCETANVYAGLAIQGDLAGDCDNKLKKWLKINQLM